MRSIATSEAPLVGPVHSAMSAEPGKLPLLPHHLVDLRSSGLSDEVIRMAGCRSVTASEAAAILGFDPGCSCLAFPYSIQGRAVLTRLKPDAPYQPPGWSKPAKYLSPLKSRSRLYIPTFTGGAALADPSTRLIITEGEKKALKATQDGFPCLAISGVWNWTKGRDPETGQRHSIADIDRVTWKDREVCIVFDSDAAENASVRQAERELAGILGARGAKVRVVRLPELDDVAKTGLDDFLASEGAEALAALLDGAPEAVPPVSCRPAWMPWWKIESRGSTSRRVFLPAVLAQFLAATEEAMADRQRWALEGRPVAELDSYLLPITGGSSFMFAGGDFYIYSPDNPGVWRPIERVRMEGTVTRIMGAEDARPTGVRGVVDLLQGLAYRPAGDLNCNADLLNVRNGLLDLKSFELGQHRSGVFSTIQLGIAFDPAADCPRFREFLGQVLINDTGGPDGQVQCLVQEFVGYCLTPDTKHEKALLLVGEGANGKSTLLKIIEQVIGPANTCSVPLEHLGDQFRLAELHGKLLNLAAEITAQGTQHASVQVFKQVVSGDLIQASRKYKNPFGFHPIAKHIFSMNDFPAVRDTSHGFWRRMLVVPFRRIFREEDQDRELMGKLLEELPGILNWALAGLAALRKQGGFTQSSSVSAYTDEFRRQTNPVSGFVEECCEVGHEEWWTASSVLYDAYSDYCGRHGIRRPVASSWFGRHMSRHDDAIRPGKGSNTDDRGMWGVRMLGNPRYRPCLTKGQTPDAVQAVSV
jgi:putative DNA primase/helicase